MVKQRWSGVGQFALLVDAIPEFQIDGGSQCFPRYLYEDGESDEGKKGTSLPLSGRSGVTQSRRDAITDAGLVHFQSAYPDETLTKDDLFYYVYGMLHSAEYRERFADSLAKELPRIPRVTNAEDFWAFSRAGRALGDIHIGYERVPEHPARVEAPAKCTAAQYRVEKMKFGKGKDRSVIHYNGFITVRDIPLGAYDYVVNGKSAIEWVMDRQRVTTDKASGIVKDANAWATETVGDPRYPLSLLLRVITVSLETMKIVRSLPALELLDERPGDSDGKVLPFRRVTPTPEQRFATCVPLVGLQAAAGAWSDVQEDLPELDDPSVEWVSWDAPPRFAKGMFVAQVRGRSMEPAIPDGAYCLFRRASLPSSPDRPVLVRHGGASDPETGGQFTVKLYREEQGPKGKKRVVLQPINSDFAPLAFGPSDADSVRVVAEVTTVLEG